MRKIVLAVPAFVLLTSCHREQLPNRLSGFDWLEGEWVNDSEFPLITREIWHQTADGMAGVSFTLENGDTIFFESMEIKKSGNTTVYIPTIGKSEKNIAFTLISKDDSEFVFENKENDFPQRIHYRPAGDSLIAWIEGGKDGKTLRMDFPYKRKKYGDVPSEK
ncbi:MAG: hypothetical protein JSS90_03815 [Bacteroidetes bacterium]|jgi:hypothetical protein|nr:hypothetical protein [Bacteroidota bacterium]